MKKSSAKILIVIILTILEICLYFVAGTYSRYTSSADSASKTRTAKWLVMLGDVDISAGKIDFSSELTLENTNPTKVAKGTIAPDTTVQGTFDIKPNGTEVAIKYTISIGEINFKDVTTGVAVTENVPNIQVSNVEVNTGKLTHNSDGTYTGNIGLNGGDVEVTITAEWTSTDNATDSNNGHTPLTVTVPVNVTVEQDV